MKENKSGPPTQEELEELWNKMVDSQEEAVSVSQSLAEAQRLVRNRDKVSPKTVVV